MEGKPKQNTRVQHVREHTKGPWRYFHHDGMTFYIHSEGNPLAGRVATITYTSGAHSFHEADAALIAAAPDLLAAAKFAYASMNSEDGRRRACASLVAAISKATQEQQR